MSQEATSIIEVFISYTHRDRKLKKELEKHLAALRAQGHISIWQDEEISPGKEWDHEIKEHLNKAHIILLLISADFIASDYCDSVEVKRALQRHEAGECRVIPIILRPVAWKRADFSKLQALPANGKPVTDWRSRDRAFLNITEGIQVAAQEILASLKINKESLTPLPQQVETKPPAPISDATKYLREPENKPKDSAINAQRSVSAPDATERQKQSEDKSIASVVTKDRVVVAWETVKMRIRQRSSLLATYTGMSEIIKIEHSPNGPVVVIQPYKPAHFRFMRDENRPKDIEWALSTEFKQPCFIRMLQPPDSIPVVPTTITTTPITQNNVTLTKELVVTAWETVKMRIRQRSSLLAAYTEMSEVIKVEHSPDGPVVVIQPHKPAHFRFMRDENRPKDIEWALSTEFKQPCFIRMLQPSDIGSTTATTSTAQNNITLTKESIAAAWENIKSRIRQKSSLLAAYVGMSEVIDIQHSLNSPTVILSVPKAHYIKFMKEEDRYKIIEWALSTEFGINCCIMISDAKT